MGYFFGPRLLDTASVSCDDLNPGSAVLRIIFGDLGLINGEWPVLGRVVNWNRSEWSMPDFLRRDLLGRMNPVLVRYADDDPNRIELELIIDDHSGMLPDSSAGYGAVEIRLSNLLG